MAMTAAFFGGMGTTTENTMGWQPGLNNKWQAVKITTPAITQTM